MRALEGGAMARRPRVVRIRAAWPGFALGSVAALLAAAIFAGGGSTDSSLVWIGGAVIGFSLAQAARAATGRVPWPRPGHAGAASLLLFASFVTWNGASVVWSIAPDRSWSYFNRGLTYLAFFAAGLFGAVLVRRFPVLLGRVLALLVTAALAWALAGKVVPELDPDGERVARLREPIGYWNALALLFALGLPLALWIAGDERGRRVLRSLGAVLVFGLVVGLLLTYSRAGVLAGAIGVAMWLALSSRRLASLAAFLAAAPFAAVLTAWAFRQPGLARDAADPASRAADGAEFGIALVIGGASVFIIAFFLSPLADSFAISRGRKPSLRWAAIVMLVTAAALGGALLAFKSGDAAAWAQRQAEEFRNPPTDLVVQDPSRLTTLNSNNRWTWWGEAWDAFVDRPVTGSGAGTFEQVHRRASDGAWTRVTEPHNEALQFLAETGVIGFLLAAGAAVAAVVAAFAAVRRLEGEERAAALALAIGLLVYVLHGLVDWDWDYLSVSAPVLLVAGALSASGRRQRPLARSRLALAGAVLLLTAGIYSLSAPWLADRRTNDAVSALADDDADRALRDARVAGSLNPVAVEPLLVQALAYEKLGNPSAAGTVLHRAVKRLPDNAKAWYELGRFQFERTQRPDLARRSLERARELDPAGPAATYLDYMRASS